MSSKIHHAHMLFALVTSLVLAAPSCLPADERATPATVLTTMTGSPLIHDGIPSSALQDGWSITFDRFLVGLGQVQLDGDACTPYSDGDYRRIFDGRTLEPQKVSIGYALGTCTVSFRVGTPDVDSIISAGVTEDDKTLMRTPGTDTYAGVSGITIYVAGRAQKDSIVKTFTWAFRQRRVGYADCTPSLGAMPVPLSLEGNASVTIDLRLRGDVLFHDQLDPAKAKLRFTPYADADDKFGNADGDVSLDELSKMTLADAGIDPLAIEVGDAAVPAIITFEDFVYLGLFPQVVGMNDTGTCTPTIRPNRPD